MRKTAKELNQLIRIDINESILTRIVNAVAEYGYDYIFIDQSIEDRLYGSFGTASDSVAWEI